MNKIFFSLMIAILLGSTIRAYDPLLDPLNDTYVTLYASQRNAEWTVGTFLNVKLSPSVSLQVDFENWIRQFIQSKEAFQPNLIDYGFGLKIDHFGWFHSCLHKIDDKMPDTDAAMDRYPIKNRFYIDI